MHLHSGLVGPCRLRHGVVDRHPQIIRIPEPVVPFLPHKSARPHDGFNLGFVLRPEGEEPDHSEVGVAGGRVSADVASVERFESPTLLRFPDLPDNFEVAHRWRRPDDFHLGWLDSDDFPANQGDFVFKIENPLPSVDDVPGHAEESLGLIHLDAEPVVSFSSVFRHPPFGDDMDAMPAAGFLRVCACKFLQKLFCDLIHVAFIVDRMVRVDEDVAIREHEGQSVDPVFRIPHRLHRRKEGRPG